MSDVAVSLVDDPGPGHRLGAQARETFAAEVRRWHRERPAAALVDVRGDAWHHAPELDRAEPLDKAAVESTYQSVVASLLQLPFPVVVAVEGRVSGFGLALTLAADARVGTGAVALSAGRGEPLAALLGAASRLTARVAGEGGYARLVWAGEEVEAHEALRLGLLSTVSDEPRAAYTLAERLAADPVGSSALKRAFLARHGDALDTTLNYEAWLADIVTGGSA